MKALLIKKLVCLGIGLGLVSGCYSTKMMEFTYQQLDTVKTTQKELLRRMDELTRLYQDDREARLRTQAETELGLQELRDALETLGFRVDDSAQLQRERAASTPTTSAGEHGGAGVAADVVVEEGVGAEACGAGVTRGAT